MSNDKLKLIFLNPWPTTHNGIFDSIQCLKVTEQSINLSIILNCENRRKIRIIALNMPDLGKYIQPHIFHTVLGFFTMF